jgi:hypothetical protein
MQRLGLCSLFEKKIARGNWYVNPITTNLFSYILIKDICRMSEAPSISMNQLS